MSARNALIVDDSESARWMLSQMLQRHDMKVDQVASAGDAMDYLRTKRPDVIFMDHMMPEIDGFQATRHVKENPVTSMIPVVMCTSNQEDDYLARARACGADSIMPKPGTDDQLSRVLQEVEELDPNELVEQDTSSEPDAEYMAPVASPSIDNAEMEQVARSVAETVLLTGLEQQMTVRLQQELAAFREEVVKTCVAAAREMADEISDQRVADLETRLGTRIDEEIADLDARLSVIPHMDPEVLEELKSSAREQAEAVFRELAPEIVAPVAQEIATRTAHELAAESANQAIRGTVSLLREKLDRVHLIVVRSIAGGAAALLALYFFR